MRGNTDHQPPRPNANHRIAFDFWGIGVVVTGDSDHILDLVRTDFSFFATDNLPTGPAIRITVVIERPPFENCPPLSPKMVQPHFVAYGRGSERWVDYHGRALSHWDFATETGTLWGTDLGLLHEKLYLLIPSRVGELLDRRGIHRIHAAGLAIDHNALLCMLPSGGGKTTMALAALSLPGVRLMSDDTPLVTRDGRVLPFPIRIGMLHPPEGIDPRHLRRFERQEHGEKWLIDIDAFGDRIAREPARPHSIILGNRLLQGEARIVPVPRHRAMGELMRSMVVGVGLPQLVEYFLRGDVSDAVSKARLVASRTAACTALLYRSRVYRFDMSRDPRKNREVLQDFIGGMTR